MDKQLIELLGPGPDSTRPGETRSLTKRIRFPGKDTPEIVVGGHEEGFHSYTLKTLPERHDHGLGVEDKGDRSVVDEVHLHMGAEPTRLDGRSPFPQLLDELVDQRLRDRSWGGGTP